MDKTVSALEDLSATDSQLGGDAPLTAEFVRALKKRRTALRDAIPSALLVAYDALGRMGRRPAVVQVRNPQGGLLASRGPLPRDVRGAGSEYFCLRFAPPCHPERSRARRSFYFAARR